MIPEKWVHTPQLCCGFRFPFLGVKIPFIVTECPAALLRRGFFTFSVGALHFSYR